MGGTIKVKPYTRATGDVSGHTRGGPGFDLVPLDGNPRQLRVVRGEVVEEYEPLQLPTRPGKPGATAHVEGSYTDRAKGFSMSTWQLSTVTGAIAWVVAGLSGAPMFALAGLVWLVGGYFVVWLAYLAHVFVSPEGAELFRAAGEYRLLREEQKERHRRMKGGR